MNIHINKNYVYTIQIGENYFSYDKNKNTVCCLENVVPYETIHLLSKVLTELEQEKDVKH